MILNPPTPKGLNDVALSLHFSVWQNLVLFITNFEATFPSNLAPSHVGYEWADEWREYIIDGQPDLQASLALIQQSNELALKARLCSVSPFLLLIGSDIKLSSSRTNIDFDDLRTLSAVDLPGAVNTLTPTPISQEFLNRYTQLRIARNKIIHLGLAATHYDPFRLLHDLIAFYGELWSDRAWLQDRLDFGSRGAKAFFDDGRHWSIAEEVMLEWEFTVQLMTGSEFKRLFRIAKSTRRYACLSCVELSTTKWSDFDYSRIATAYLSSQKELFCLMCQSKFSVERNVCPNSHCKGNVMAVAGKGYAPRCHSCGVDI